MLGMAMTIKKKFLIMMSVILIVVCGASITLLSSNNFLLEQFPLDQIYKNVDELKHVPSRLHFYLSKHLYLHASLLLLEVKEHQELRLINGLSSIDLQIKEERSTLEEQLHIELIYQLFDEPCRNVLKSKNIRTLTNRQEQFYI